VKDGDLIRVGGLVFKVLHTPGHTPGGVCFYTDGHLIAGDTLFPGGPGNTRREGGDFPLIIQMISEKLFALPDETRVYPGHGLDTTIGAERPHLREWIDRGW
jgi:glyoxylase-like metal-dependent hydrolase (beta-lactamase superfamily II)